MGMYNYIGDAGDQVKCFYVPCIPVSKDELGVYRASVGTSGGRLVNVNQTPYMTPFYNYGKDIAILDYPLMWDKEKTQVHIVRNGHWVRTITVSEMEDDFDLPKTVINGYGTRYFIDSVPHLRQFLIEAEDAHNGYESAYNTALEDANLARFPSITEWRQLSHEEVQARHAFYMGAMDAAFNEHQKPFNDKWIDNTHESDLDMLGLAFADYLESLHDDGWKRHEFEWYVIFTDVIDRLSKNFANPVEDYLNWCAKEGIDSETVDEDMLREIVEKYTGTISDEIFNDYEKMREERGW